MEPKPIGSKFDFGSTFLGLARAFRGTLVWYTFLLPPLLLIILFVVYPTLLTFRQSFFTRGVGDAEQFAGLRHYQRLITSEVFWGALGNTVLLGAAFLVIVIPLATALASMLNRLRCGSTPLKVIYFLPQLTSSVAVALMFNYVFQPDWGLLNGGLRGLGVDPLPLWLADPRLNFTGSRAAVTLLAVWAGLGYFIIVVLAGLQSIPSDLYDAAALDGANGLQVWWSITLPSLRPTFVFLIMTGTVDALARFGDLWTLGGPGGAPARSLQSVVMFIFQSGFESGDVSMAAAAAVLFFLIVLGVTVVSFWGFLGREFRATR
ncbi:MAG: carbohydrate ABC transporter permease [Devosia sp.]